MEDKLLQELSTEGASDQDLFNASTPKSWSLMQVMLWLIVIFIILLIGISIWFLIKGKSNLISDAVKVENYNSIHIIDPKNIRDYDSDSYSSDSYSESSSDSDD